jgi:hypothetical protein
MSPAARAFLAEYIEAGQLGDDWQAIDSLQFVITQLTAMQIASRVRAAGLSEEAAINEAAAHLGIPAETIRTRHQRGYRQTRGLS